MADKDEELSLFLEMRRREKEQDNLLLNNSDEFETPLGKYVFFFFFLICETCVYDLVKKIDCFLNGFWSCKVQSLGLHQCLTSQVVLQLGRQVLLMIFSILKATKMTMNGNLFTNFFFPAKMVCEHTHHRVIGDYLNVFASMYMLGMC